MKRLKKTTIYRAAFVGSLIFLLIVLTGCTKAGEKQSVARSDGSVWSGSRTAYHDGTYTAESAAAPDEPKITLTLTVKEGLITRVTFSERSDAAETLENRLIRSQNAKKLPTIKSETQLSRDFKKLAKAALKNSREKQTGTAVVTLKKSK